VLCPEENARFLRPRHAGIFDIPGKPDPALRDRNDEFDFLGKATEERKNGQHFRSLIADVVCRCTRKDMPQQIENEGV
jgi:hypothetical protein